MNCSQCKRPTENALGVCTSCLGGKNPDAVALGRRGGLKGGPARAAALGPEGRREAAKKAANKRWSGWECVATFHQKIIDGKIDVDDEYVADQLAELMVTLDEIALRWANGSPNGHKNGKRKVSA